MKRIVIYYSLEGNTTNAAQTISKALGADMVRLEPVKDIPKKGFAKFAVGGFYALSGHTPQLQPLNGDFSEYGEIILGIPVWAGRPAPAVNTLIRDYDVADKITAVFTFSGSGDNSSCIRVLKKKLPNLAHTVSLYDSRSDASSENNVRLETFINNMQP